VSSQARSCLIGYSGFVGSNLAARHSFTDLFRSNSIEEIRGRQYDLLVCAGAPAEKWKANQHPQADRANIDRLIRNVAEARAASAFLISTVDVYPVTRGADESYDCEGLSNHAYGANRLVLEKAFREIFPEVHIVRLPGLFGPGLKKNVIYDLLHDNCLDAINPGSFFQYYDVTSLWEDLRTIQEHQLDLVNLVTEPLGTERIVDTFFPHKQVGPGKGAVVHYDLRSRNAELFGGNHGYRSDADCVLSRLGAYIRSAGQGAAG
jgi:hypothetical protein